jgi:Ser-tRNA(Ala) deacylase AlaX
MQQHTGQHLITALAKNLFGWKTLSWNLGPEKCSIDLSCAQISPEQMIQLEEALDEAVLARKPVRVFFC